MDGPWRLPREPPRSALTRCDLISPASFTHRAIFCTLPFPFTLVFPRGDLFFFFLSILLEFYASNE